MFKANIDPKISWCLSVTLDLISYNNTFGGLSLYKITLLLSGYG